MYEFDTFSDSFDTGHTILYQVSLLDGVLV